MYIPAPLNYPLRDPKYHLVETIRPVLEVHWGVLVGIDIDMHKQIRVYMHTPIYIYVYMYIYIYIYIYMCMYLCMYKHTQVFLYVHSLVWTSYSV